jgi:hypothetical protein
METEMEWELRLGAGGGVTSELLSWAGWDVYLGGMSGAHCASRRVLHFNAGVTRLIRLLHMTCIFPFQLLSRR